jgi:DNA-binding GntR family transcriptional regulator
VTAGGSATQRTDRSDGLALPTFADRASLRERVADALRAAVISGEMRPGEVYSAPALATRFGVSATPVREAMLDLAKEGLVVPVRNKGFRVTTVSERDLDEITAIRMLLEPPAVAGAASIARAEDLAALRELAAAIVTAAEGGDLVAYVESDREFHLHLLALGGNRRLVEIVSDLRAQTRLFGLAQLAQRGELSESAREHHELLDLIAAGDHSGAEALVRRHIGHVRRRWAALLPDGSFLR